MVKLKLMYFCDEDLGECQAMFDEAGKLIDAWYDNDACWRTEYFDGVMKHLGVVVKSVDPTKAAKAQVMAHFGL